MRFNQRLVQTVSEAAMILTAASFNCQPARAIELGRELFPVSKADSGSGVGRVPPARAFQSNDK